MCHNLATSKEHVPPKSFFLGDSQSVSGIDYRKNLITVPSCDQHNTDKSKDDVYLLFMVSINYESNPEAHQTFNIRLKEYIKANPHLLREFNKEGVITTINGHPSYGYPVDQVRFNKEIDCIARAIHYHHFGIQWNAKLTVISPSLRIFPHNYPLSQVFEYNSLLFQIKNWALKEIKSLPKHGHNQEIFYYKVYEDQSINLRVLIMVFFTGFVTVVLPEDKLEFMTQFYLWTSS
jgi:hypothetical protein